MALFKYTALRSLTTGVSAGSTQTRSISLRALNRQRRAVGETQVALGGTPYSTWHRGDVLYQCETTLVTGNNRDYMREFLDSAESGQTFQFDPDNTAVPSPLNWTDVVLESNTYTENRAGRLGAGSGGDGDYFTFRFTLRAV